MTAQDHGGPGVDKKRRSFWFDPRFAIGLALIVVSVFGVLGLVSSADSSVDVLAARATIAPGQKVKLADLVPTSVRAGRAEKLYLRASDVPTAGVLVTRAVVAGELIPVSAVGSTAGRRLTSIVVSANTPLAQSIAPGARVDVWSARQIDNSEFDAPAVIASSAIVVRLVDQKNLVATGAGSSVELLVPRSSIASVLEAIANGAALSVLPVDLSVGE
ncbi:MAG TPA: hypothetical protein VIJ76_03685 [Galbitalea sp.]